MQRSTRIRSTSRPPTRLAHIPNASARVLNARTPGSAAPRTPEPPADVCTEELILEPHHEPVGVHRNHEEEPHPQHNVRQRVEPRHRRVGRPRLGRHIGRTVACFGSGILSVQLGVAFQHEGPCIGAVNPVAKHAVSVRLVLRRTVDAEQCQPCKQAALGSANATE
eukprot:2885559-Prymnesium_polylepis.3